MIERAFSSPTAWHGEGYARVNATGLPLNALLSMRYVPSAVAICPWSRSHARLFVPVERSGRCRPWRMRRRSESSIECGVGEKKDIVAAHQVDQRVIAARIVLEP